MTLLEPLNGDRVLVTSTAPASVLSPEAKVGDRFFGKEHLINNVQVFSEQPWHTHLINYIAMGMSNKEAATACEVTPEFVGQILRQPWFQERVRDKLAEGQSSVLELFRGAAVGAFVTLVEIMSDEKAPKAVRVASAKEILDRHLGKSTQVVENITPIVPTDPVAEHARLVESLQSSLLSPLS